MPFHAPLSYRKGSRTVAQIPFLLKYSLHRRRQVLVLERSRIPAMAA